MLIAKKHQPLILFAALLTMTVCYSQNKLPVAKLNVEYGNSFEGFELLDAANKDVIIITEDTHNRMSMPRTTLKFLQYLHKINDTKVLAIEAGTSTAWLINRYLDNQDTLLLKEISRHTFYWGIEQRKFLQALATWNLQLMPHEKIKVVSADIELKQESVVLALNILLNQRDIPSSMSGLKTFRDVYEEKSAHRNSFDALNVFFYYDKKRCEKATKEILDDITQRRVIYEAFFGDDLKLVTTMLTDLLRLYDFNYHQINLHKRDEIIYRKLVDLHTNGINQFLYVVGFWHAGVGRSSDRLAHDPTSPFYSKVLLAIITGRMQNGKFQGAKKVTALSRIYPDVFCDGCNVLIRNNRSTKCLTQVSDYTIAFGNNDHVRKFVKTFEGE